MLEPQIIYEDKDFLVVNKPAGLLVHGVNVKNRALVVEEKTLVDWLLARYPEIKGVGDPVKLPNGNYATSEPETGPTLGPLRQRSEASEARSGLPERPGIVHRLDKETSGIMLVARNQKSFEYLKSLFKERKIKKTYLALVWGEPKNRHGIIDRPLGIKSGSIKRTVHSDKMAKEAVTEYRVLKNYQLPITNYQITLLEVFPKTGRTHQIRVHLASIGHPVVGDGLYGNKKLQDSSFKLHDERLMLHAKSIEFVSGNGHIMRFEADTPPIFAK